MRSDDAKDLAGIFHRTPDAAHVWVVPIQTLEPRFHNVLSAEERERAARFRFDPDRERFLASHVALRQLVGTYMGVAAEAVQFREGPRGKPRVEGGLEFNLSHSGDLALVGIARAPVGVDIERIAPRKALMNIAARYFHTDETAWLESRGEGERLREFYRLWTMKEAFLKATGTGLAGGLDRKTDPATIAGFSCADVDPDPDYAAAVVIEGTRVSTHVAWFSFPER